MAIPRENRPKRPSQSQSSDEEEQTSRSVVSASEDEEEGEEEGEEESQEDDDSESDRAPDRNASKGSLPPPVVESERAEEEEEESGEEDDGSDSDEALERNTTKDTHHPPPAAHLEQVGEEEEEDEERGEDESSDDDETPDRNTTDHTPLPPPVAQAERGEEESGGDLCSDSDKTLDPNTNEDSGSETEEETPLPQLKHTGIDGGGGSGDSNASPEEEQASLPLPLNSKPPTGANVGSSKKRNASESPPEQLKSDGKKMKTSSSPHGIGSCSSGSKLSRRLFSVEDEVDFLNALVEVKKKTGLKELCFIPWSEILEFLSDSFLEKFSKSQIANKFGGMRRKFKTYLVKIKGGKEIPGKPHNQLCFDLMKELWMNNDSDGGKKKRRRKQLSMKNSDAGDQNNVKRILRRESGGGGGSKPSKGEEKSAAAGTSSAEAAAESPYQIIFNLLPRIIRPNSSSLSIKSVETAIEQMEPEIVMDFVKRVRDLYARQLHLSILKHDLEKELLQAIEQKFLDPSSK